MTFSDFGLDGNVTTALGLQYYGGSDVTILSSRTTNRYRLQSDRCVKIFYNLCIINTKVTENSFFIMRM